MFRRSISKLFQQGVHTPLGEQFTGAKMKQWPEQAIPAGFTFTPEQRFSLKAMPRDVGRIPRNFVLQILYRQQPASVDGLWESCQRDSGMVLESRRHLREVLKQAREEGFIYFERDSETQAWQCLLTRERYAEVEKLVDQAAENAVLESPTLRGEAVAETEGYSTEYQSMSVEDKLDHIAKLKEQVLSTSAKVRSFTRNEVDYLPYTDLNGKVNFMWWYEAKDGAPTTKKVPAFQTNAALPT